MLTRKKEHKRIEVEEAYRFFQKFGVDIYSLNLMRLQGEFENEYNKYFENLNAAVSPATSGETQVIITGRYAYYARTTGRRIDNHPVSGDVHYQTIEHKVTL